MNLIQQAIEAGNIVRTQWPSDLSRHLNLYLGSGRCGASFDPYGLMNCGYRGRLAEIPTNTYVMHAEHWHRGDYGIDFWLPVYKLVWADEVQPPTGAYRQELELLTATLKTEMAWPGRRVVFEASTNPDRRDVLAFRIRHDGPMAAIRLACVLDIHTNYDQHVHSTMSSPNLLERRWRADVTAGTARSVIGVTVRSREGSLTLRGDGEGLRIECEGTRGDHLLLISVARPDRADEVAREIDGIATIEDWQGSSAEAWSRRWGDACVLLENRNHQAMWARSLFWTLCSYAPDVRSPAAPMGWSGNGWPFHFPQDISYIHPALLRLGHFDIARSVVEFYRGYLDGMKEYTRRIYKTGGAYWAWEFPIGLGSEKTLNRDAIPNPYQFEIHNAAYPARMAFETARHMGDPKWTREVAWPIVFESARFLAAVAARESSGHWSLHVKPSMGQDEMGGENQRNYLCSLFSAQYALGKALEMAVGLRIENDDLRRFERILADGLSYDRLYDARMGLCATCEGIPIEKQVGFEKHPIQINPLIFLPMGQPVDDPVRTAYNRRRDLCAGGDKNFYYGWTLAAYWLAASHMGDAKGLAGDLGLAVGACYVDPDWIQIYETSQGYKFPFYVTSHGLYLQAVQDAIVSDYWGPVQIGAAAPESWGQIQFAGLRTGDGRTWSGSRNAAGRWDATSRPSL